MTYVLRSVSMPTTLEIILKQDYKPYKPELYFLELLHRDAATNDYRPKRLAIYHRKDQYHHQREIVGLTSHSKTIRWRHTKLFTMTIMCQFAYNLLPGNLFGEPQGRLAEIDKFTGDFRQPNYRFSEQRINQITEGHFTHDMRQTAEQLVARLDDYIVEEGALWQGKQRRTGELIHEALKKIDFAEHR